MASTPFDLAVAHICVKENADPYRTYLYLKALFEAFFFSFNSIPGHLAMLELSPPDGSHGAFLMWEEPTPTIVPLSVNVLVNGLHDSKTYQGFIAELADGLPLVAVVQSLTQAVQERPFFKELSSVASKEPDLEVVNQFVTKYAKEV
jgi:hypothetical protein